MTQPETLAARERAELNPWKRYVMAVVALLAGNLLVDLVGFAVGEDWPRIAGYIGAVFYFAVLNRVPLRSNLHNHTGATHD